MYIELNFLFLALFFSQVPSLENFQSLTEAKMTKSFIGQIILGSSNMYIFKKIWFRKQKRALALDLKLV